MNTRYKKHLEAFKNTVVSVVSSGELWWAQIPFLSSVLRGDIQNYCKFELQSPDNMTIVNKLLYIDSYYLASMVIFSNVLKR